MAKKKQKTSFILRILFLLNMITGLLTLVSYSSPHIAPDKFWPPAFFGLLYPYLLLLNLFFILFWLLFKKRYIFLSIICLLIGWSHIGKIMQWGNQNKEQGEIVVASFNMKNFDFARPASKEEKTMKTLVNFIEQKKVDVICFQEFYFKNQQAYENYIISHTNLKHFQANKNANLRGKMGLAVFSKYPIVNQEKIVFQNSRYNYAAFIDLKVNHDTIRVYNIHFQSIRLVQEDYHLIDELNEHAMETKDVKSRSRRLAGKVKKGFQLRAEQARTMQQKITKSPYPAIVCGDFNDTPLSYAYETMTKNLKDTFVEAGQGIPSTFSALFPLMRIDYILIDNSFSCQNYHTGNLNISDHYPVVAKLKTIQ